MNRLRSARLAGHAAQAAGSGETRRQWRTREDGHREAATPAVANQSLELVLRGPLDMTALVAAIDDLPGRYPFLCRRTLAVVAPAGRMPGSPTTVVDLSEQAAPDARSAHTWSRYRKYLGLDSSFEDRNLPLLRSTLLRLDAELHLLSVVAPRSACDPASLGVMMRDLGRLYSARLRGESPESPLPVRMREPAGEVGASGAPQSAGRGAIEASAEIEGAAASAATACLPTDRPRPASGASVAASVEFIIEPQLADAVERLAARVGVDELCVYLGAYALLLARLSGGSNPLVGLDRAELAAATLPLLSASCGEVRPAVLPVDLRQSGERLLEDVQALARKLAAGAVPAADDAAAPADVPMTAAGPVAAFRCGVRLSPEVLDFAGLAVEVVPVGDGFDGCEVALSLVHGPHGLAGEWRHDQRLFDTETIRAWAACFRTLLCSLAEEAASPLALLELVPDEQLRRLSDWNSAAPAHGIAAAAALHELVARAARRAPAQLALEVGGARITYGELEARSNRLARLLQVRGASADVRVGVLLRPGIDLAVAQLAVLKSSAACVLLDPRLADAEIERLLEAGGASLLVARVPPRHQPGVTLVHLDDDAADIDAQPDTPFAAASLDRLGSEAAFIVAAKRVDGTPLVVLPHRAVGTSAQRLGHWIGLKASDRLLVVPEVEHPAFSLEMLAALEAGAQVQVLDQVAGDRGCELRALLQSAPITAMVAPAAVWHELIAAGWAGSSGFKALVPALGITAQLASGLIRRGVAPWSFHGPLEATGWVTCTQLDHLDAVRRVPGGETREALGSTGAGAAVWMFDDNGQPCAIGVPGEICIGGDCLSAGYLDQPQLTAERFVPDVLGPRGGRKLFRSGQRGRWRHDGIIEYLGPWQAATPASVGPRAEELPTMPARQAVSQQAPEMAAQVAPAMAPRMSPPMEWLAGLQAERQAPATTVPLPRAPMAQSADVRVPVPAMSERPFYADVRHEGDDDEASPDLHFTAIDDQAPQAAWHAQDAAGGHRLLPGEAAAAPRRFLQRPAAMALAGVMLGSAAALGLFGERLLEMAAPAFGPAPVADTDRVAAGEADAPGVAGQATEPPRARPVIVELPNPVPVVETHAATAPAGPRQASPKEASAISPQSATQATVDPPDRTPSIGQATSTEAAAASTPAARAKGDDPPVAASVPATPSAPAATSVTVGPTGEASKAATTAASKTPAHGSAPAMAPDAPAGTAALAATPAGQGSQGAGSQTVAGDASTARKEAGVANDATVATDATVAKDGIVAKDAVAAEDAVVAKDAVAAEDALVAKDALVARDAPVEKEAVATTGAADDRAMAKDVAATKDAGATQPAQAGVNATTPAVAERRSPAEGGTLAGPSDTGRQSARPAFAVGADAPAVEPRVPVAASPAANAVVATPTAAGNGVEVPVVASPAVKPASPVPAAQPPVPVAAAPQPAPVVAPASPAVMPAAKTRATVATADETPSAAATVQRSSASAAAVVAPTSPAPTVAEPRPAAPVIPPAQPGQPPAAIVAQPSATVAQPSNTAPAVAPWPAALPPPPALNREPAAVPPTSPPPVAPPTCRKELRALGLCGNLP